MNIKLAAAAGSVLLALTACTSATEPDTMITADTGPNLEQLARQVGTAAARDQLAGDPAWCDAWVVIGDDPGAESAFVDGFIEGSPENAEYADEAWEGYSATMDDACK